MGHHDDGKGDILYMKVRKPSNARLFDDGYDDAKAGKPPIDRRVFESPIDYQIYMNGYEKGGVKAKPQTLDDLFGPSLPFMGASGVCLPVYEIRGSGCLWNHEYERVARKIKDLHGLE